MFKLRVIAPVMVMAIFGLGLSAQAQITGSSHDFSGELWAVNGEICNVCHTPHDADTSVAGAPLWDHQVSTSAGYTPYTSDTLNASVGQPDHYSAKLCLSCHDGTVAKDSFGGVSGGDFMVGTDYGYIGLDLSTEHPISFTYDDTLASVDGGLFTPSDTLSGLGGTIAEDLLFSNTLGCASCHDVHNADGITNMLRKNNEGSAFCLTCHDK